jgi:hypothetical protein
MKAGNKSLSAMFADENRHSQVCAFHSLFCGLRAFSQEGLGELLAFITLYHHADDKT